MNYLAANIRFLRKEKELTQDELALKLSVNRSMIGAYEEGRAVPRIGVLQALSVFFNKSIDDLINLELSSGIPGVVDFKGMDIRVVTTVVDKDERELITIVPVKASAGYLNGYGDREYIGQLSRFSLPVPELGNERTRRVFQIRGDSMLPVQPGSYILCEYLQNWTELADGETYILLTQNDGIVYKRVYNHIARDKKLTLSSDNPDYTPYTVPINDVREIWKAIGVISFDLGHKENPQLHELVDMVMEMRKELDDLKKGRNMKKGRDD
ncbi:MAG: LexA family transcriptional regulator [Bacteroidota bacterium]|nr:LexA family transcriptional regulator [Bacteroidota bacterium]